MSEQIKHECGVAMVRLRKPLAYYKEKYGTYLYGLNKLYLLMEKQHNRGQEGAGLSCVKLCVSPGEEYIFRERALGANAIQEIFGTVKKNITKYEHDLSNYEWVERHLPFVGELYMGHLRYSTTGNTGISYVHPFLRRNNWRARNLVLCGNFNMTNVDEIFSEIVSKGQHPRSYGDTFIMLEQLGHELDMENEKLYAQLKAEGMKGLELAREIENRLKVENILRQPAQTWDGGYVICGQTGSGDMFAFRDPKGIRPAFYYYDDEIVVVASERPVIQTSMCLEKEQVQELGRGQCLVVNKKGEVKIKTILEAKENEACSFERIYFSRGSDADIYNERKALGRNLADRILESVNHDIDNTVFSFIPNTAEVAFYGMIEGVDRYLSSEKIKKIVSGHLSAPQIHDILAKKVRIEKVAIKDIKLRTFITEDSNRDELAAHVYDITYGTVRPHIDNLVVIDDSIVRGTTLRQSIVKILDRLHPRKIVIVSSSPQVRYPDCYGIDMSRMGEFIAFKAAMELLKERGMTQIAAEVYSKSKAQADLPKEQIVNYVRDIYAPFTQEEISSKIAEMITTPEIGAKVEIIYQDLDGLHQAIPNHPGDWYFSGKYPTPGGNRVVNNAFINYYEGFENKR